jgi:hypothetical protein
MSRWRRHVGSVQRARPHERPHERPRTGGSADRRAGCDGQHAHTDERAQMQSRHSPGQVPTPPGERVDGRAGQIHPGSVHAGRTKTVTKTAQDRSTVAAAPYQNRRRAHMTVEGGAAGAPQRHHPARAEAYQTSQ